MARKPSSDDKDSDVARKIWLAGIGAYGRALGDAQERVTKVGKQTTQVFEDLVSKGEDLEEKFGRPAKKAGQKLGTDALHSFEDRMHRMRSVLGLSGEAAEETDQRLSAMEKKLDTIEAKLDRLLASNTRPKTTTKKATTKKKAAKKVTRKKA